MDLGIEKESKILSLVAAANCSVGRLVELRSEHEPLSTAIGRIRPFDDRVGGFELVDSSATGVFREAAKRPDPLLCQRAFGFKQQIHYASRCTAVLHCEGYSWAHCRGL